MFVVEAHGCVLDYGMLVVACGQVLVDAVHSWLHAVHYHATQWVAGDRAPRMWLALLLGNGTAPVVYMLRTDE